MGPGPTVVSAFPLVHNSYRWREATKGSTMERESVFRSITAALLISAVSISVYHRHKAEKAGEEEISLNEEGSPTVVALRSSGLVLVLSVVAYLINPRWTRWFSVDLPASVRWSGAGLGAACLPLAY